MLEKDTLQLSSQYRGPVYGRLQCETSRRGSAVVRACGSKLVVAVGVNDWGLGEDLGKAEIVYAGEVFKRRRCSGAVEHGGERAVWRTKGVASGALEVE